MTRFKLFVHASTSALELEMNDWARELPAGAKVRRTQLAATDHRVVVLVSYEMPPPAAENR